MKRKDEAVDLYVLVVSIELGLHNLLRALLELKYGDDWWREGVPLTIRVKCVSMREEDDDPVDDPFRYTTIVDLIKIAEKHWSDRLKFAGGFRENEKSRFRSEMDRLNRIRNGVMHPVQARSWGPDDFEFVRALKIKLSPVTLDDPN